MLIPDDFPYQILFNATCDAIFVHLVGETGVPGRFVAVNNQACVKYGYTRQELMRMSPAELRAPGTVAGIENIYDKLVRERQALFEMTHKTKDGRHITDEVSSHWVEIKGRQLVVSIHRDISERREAEKQRIRSERFQGVLEMAGSAAHELNQPLQAILGYADMLLKNAIENPRDAPRWAQRVHDQVERLAVITKKLNNITRYEVQDYLNGIKIIDLENASRPVATV